MARLGDRGQDGDCLFRPSTRGVHMLHLTVRLAADCYLHIDVREGNKVMADIEIAFKKIRVSSKEEIVFKGYFCSILM